MKSDVENLTQITKEVRFKGLSVRVERKLDNERQEIVIVVDDDTTLQSIKEHWYQIVNLKNELLKQQGSNTKSPDVYPLISLIKKHESGMSYQEIAEMCNSDLLFYICMGYVQHEDGIDPMGIRLAFVLMRNLMFKRRNAKQFISEAIDILDDGILPFDEFTGPITRDHVRDTIRYTRKRMKTGKLVVKSKLPNQKITQEEINSNPYWLKTKDFKASLEKRG